MKVYTIKVHSKPTRDEEKNNYTQIIIHANTNSNESSRNDTRNLRQKYGALTQNNQQRNEMNEKRWQTKNGNSFFEEQK